MGIVRAVLRPQYHQRSKGEMCAAEGVGLGFLPDSSNTLLSKVSLWTSAAGSSVLFSLADRLTPE